jgi:hypothetical protein
MISEDDFYAIAEAKPDVIRVFCNAVNAIIDMRKETAAPPTSPSSPWADVRLKEKQAAARELMTQFADCFVANGQPLSEDETKLVQSWVLRAANFHLRKRAEEDEVDGHDAPGAAEAAPTDIEAVA